MDPHDEDNVFTRFAAGEELEDEFVHPAEVGRRRRRPRLTAGFEHFPRLTRGRLLILAVAAVVAAVVATSLLGSGGGRDRGKTEVSELPAPAKPRSQRRPSRHRPGPRTHHHVRGTIHPPQKPDRVVHNEGRRRKHIENPPAPEAEVSAAPAPEPTVEPEVEPEPEPEVEVEPEIEVEVEPTPEPAPERSPAPNGEAAGTEFGFER